MFNASDDNIVVVLIMAVLLIRMKSIHTN